MKFDVDLTLPPDLQVNMDDLPEVFPDINAVGVTGFRLLTLDLPLPDPNFEAFDCFSEEADRIVEEETRPKPPPPPAPPPSWLYDLNPGKQYTPLPLLQYRYALLPPEEIYEPIEEFPIARGCAIAGAMGYSKQFGLLGRRFFTKQPVLIDLVQPLAMGYFGINSAGKSYSLGSMAEMCLQCMKGVNALHDPYCAVWLHYHSGSTYEPQMLSSVFPTMKIPEVERLYNEMWALPQGVRDVLVLTLENQVLPMRQRHRHVQVQPILFPLAELGILGLRSLLGLDNENSALYGKQVELLIQELTRDGENLTWKRLLQGVLRTRFSPQVRELLLTRLQLVRPWIDDSVSLKDYIKPGRLILVDIRDEWLPQDQAMEIFGSVSAILALHPDRSKHREKRADNDCSLLLIYDEAYKFVKSRIIRDQMDTAIRERRHLRLTVLVASQDPLAIPGPLLTLLDCIAVGAHASQEWNNYLIKHQAGLAGMKTQTSGILPPGVMWFWSSRWTYLDEEMGEFGEPILMHMRPRVSYHGGHSKFATNL